MGVTSLPYPGDRELEQGSWPSGSHDLSVPHKNVPWGSGAGVESQMSQWDWAPHGHLEKIAESYVCLAGLVCKLHIPSQAWECEDVKSRQAGLGHSPDWVDALGPFFFPHRTLFFLKQFCVFIFA